MSVIAQVQLFYLVSDKVLLQARVNAFDRSVELQVLKHCQVVINSVKLRTVADFLPGASETDLRTNIVPCHVQTSLVWDFLLAETLECGSLASACDPQQGEALAIVQCKGQVINSLRERCVGLCQRVYL